MTRYHYIKKGMYLQYRLAMLPTSTKRYYETRYSTWNKRVPYPPFSDGAQTYQEEWDKICGSLRWIKGLEDLK